MVIKYGCIILRAIEEKDTDLLLELMNDPNIENMTVGWHHAISRKEQEKWIQDYKNTDRNIRLMIELTNGVTIGMISLCGIDWKNRTAVLGYKIQAFTKGRIRGDMYDAVYGILQYAFDELNLNCIEGRVIEYNSFSIKLAKKLGFVEEGLLRNRAYKKGKYHNEVIFSLLREEFIENSSSNES